MVRASVHWQGKETQKQIKVLILIRMYFDGKNRKLAPKSRKRRTIIQTK